MPTDPVTSVVVGAASRIAVTAGKSIVDRLIGSAGQRALEAALRSALTSAANDFPDLSAIGADIELIADDRVADELLANAIDSERGDWADTFTRWADVYGEQPPEHARLFLARAADVLRDAMQRDPNLQLLWTALSVGHISDQVAETALSVSQVDDHLADVSVRVDAIARPELAMRLRSSEIGSSAAYALQLANELHAHVAQGSLGRAMEVRMEITDTGAHASFTPRAGVDYAVQLHTSDPEGLIRGIEDGGMATLPAEAVRVTADGAEVPLLREGTVQISRAPSQQTAIAELRSGDDQVRFVVKFRETFGPGQINLDSVDSAPAGLSARISITREGRTLNLALRETDAVALSDQVTLARAAAILSNGASAHFDFMENGMSLDQTTPAIPEFAEWGRYLPVLAMVQELRTAGHGKNTLVDTVPTEDVLVGQWALNFIRTGSATFDRVNGTIGFFLGRDDVVDIRAEGARFAVGGRITRFIVPLHSGPVEIGQALLTVTGAASAELRTGETGPDSLLITLDAESVMALTRPTEPPSE